MGRLLHAFYAIQKNIFNLIIGGFVVRRTGRRIRSRGWVGGRVGGPRHRLSCIMHSARRRCEKRGCFSLLPRWWSASKIHLSHTTHNKWSAWIMWKESAPPVNRECDPLPSSITNFWSPAQMTSLHSTIIFSMYFERVHQNRGALFAYFPFARLMTPN